MTRLEAMERFLKPYAVEWVKEQIPIVKNEPNQEICSLIENLFYDIKGIQSEQEWIPSCLAVFYLESSLYTQTYEYQVSISNRELYMDEARQERFWTPDFMKQDMDLQRKHIRKALTKKFVRIKDYEVECMFRLLLKQYKNMMEVYLLDVFKQVADAEWFKDIEKEETFLFVSGTYMGEIKPVLVYENKF